MVYKITTSKSPTKKILVILLVLSFFVSFLSACEKKPEIQEAPTETVTKETETKPEPTLPTPTLPSDRKGLKVVGCGACYPLKKTKSKTDFLNEILLVNNEAVTEKNTGDYVRVFFEEQIVAVYRYNPENNTEELLRGFPMSAPKNLPLGKFTLGEPDYDVSVVYGLISSISVALGTSGASFVSLPSSNGTANSGVSIQDFNRIGERRETDSDRNIYLLAMDARWLLEHTKKGTVVEFLPNGEKVQGKIPDQISLPKLALNAYTYDPTNLRDENNPYRNMDVLKGALVEEENDLMNRPDATKGSSGYLTEGEVDALWDKLRETTPPLPTQGVPVPTEPFAPTAPVEENPIDLGDIFGGND